MRPSGIDIGILVIVGVFVFLGWKKGVVKMGFRLLSHLASLALAWVFHPYLAAVLQTTPLYEKLFSAATERITAGEQAVVNPGILQELLTKSTQTAVNVVAEYFAKLLLNGISFLLLLVLARILIFFVRKILNFVASLPVIGFFNRLAGMIIGLFEGLLVVCIILSVVAVVPTLRDNKPLGYAIEQSVVTRSLYLNNPVLKILTPEVESSAEK